MLKMLSKSFTLTMLKSGGRQKRRKPAIFLSRNCKTCRDRTVDPELARLVFHNSNPSVNSPIEPVSCLPARLPHSVTTQLCVEREIGVGCIIHVVLYSVGIHLDGSGDALD